MVDWEACSLKSHTSFCLYCDCIWHWWILPYLLQNLSLPRLCVCARACACVSPHTCYPLLHLLMETVNFYGAFWLSCRFALTYLLVHFVFPLCPKIVMVIASFETFNLARQTERRISHWEGKVPLTRLAQYIISHHTSGKSANLTAFMVMLLL